MLSLLGPSNEFIGSTAASAIFFLRVNAFALASSTLEIVFSDRVFLPFPSGELVSTSGL